MAGRNFICKECNEVRYIMFSDELSVDDVNETCKVCGGTMVPRIEAGSFKVNGKLFIGGKQ